ncbi:MAG: sulfotransferase [Desulfobacterales bacterium]
MKYVYILSLSHSGSTYLELLLSKHDKIGSLGEIYQTISSIYAGAENKKLCPTCQADMSGCSFWGEHRNLIMDKTEAESYRLIKREFKEKHKDLEYLVDSSKKLCFLTEFYDPNVEDIRVLMLFRDVRGWVQSIENKALREKSRKYWKYSLGFPANSYYWLYCYLRWKKILGSKFHFQLVSYENLVFQPKASLEHIFKFLELSPQDFSINSPSLSHNIEGNRMRKTFSKDSTIRYDNSWMKDFRHMLYAPVLLPVHYVNSRIQKPPQDSNS